MLICPHCHLERNGTGGPCTRCGEVTKHLNGFPSFAPDIATASAGFDPRRYRFLASVEDRHFWFRSRSRLVAWALSHFFPEAKSFLEVGCGTGAVLRHLRSARPEVARIAGADVHVEGLAFARSRLDAAVELYQMDARSIPFRHEFDVVGCFDILEHVREDEQVLAGLRLAVQRGGGLLLTVPQHQWLWSQHDEVARHFRRYAGRSLGALVEAAGFQVVYRTSFVSLLLPLMALSRWLERGREVGESEGMSVGGLLNATLYGVMTLERTLIAAGARMPLGGSILLVARTA